ncbi:MAG: ABC transporter ATP-binding protein [Planctomycetota bacterium]|nr:ABC transporter ATP-binding protein [Planctomycetota bacterium]
MSDALIEVFGLTHYFDGPAGTHKALDNVSLEMVAGEIFAVIGPSGCGKTTLLNIIGGFVDPSEGEVRVHGERVRGPAPDRGVIFQGYALYRWLTVQENVEFGLKILGLGRKARAERARHYLALVGLDEFRSHYTYQLSGGMKQRVAIARALAADPEILLLDEPFGALDAQMREILQEELLRIWDKTRKTIFLITHSVEEAVFLSHRTCVMTARPGRIKQILEINLPQPRYDFHVRTSPQFNAYKERVLEMVREEVGSDSRPDHMSA